MISQAPEVILGTDLQAWYGWAQTIPPRLEKATAKTELRYLLGEVTDLDSISLALGAWDAAAEIQSSLGLEALTTLWQTRWQTHTPLAYLLGYVYWRDFKLNVTPAVLIPRPETEHLIDLAQAQTTPALESGIWVDLGVGSGAITLGLAQQFPQAQIYGVDISLAALAIAQANIAANLPQAQNRIYLKHGSLWQPLAELQGQIAGLVTNPPYIPQAQIPHLQPEVSQNEPWLALDGGPDGLDLIREIVVRVGEFLQPGGIILLEIMAGQGAAVKALLQQTGVLTEIAIHPDLAGHDRYAFGRKQTPTVGKI